MRYIEKHAEPKSLAEYKKQKNVVILSLHFKIKPLVKQ